MKIIKRVFEQTNRYGLLSFLLTDKGWFWQYDMALLFDAESGCISHPSGAYMPDVEDVECFFETLEEARQDCFECMSNHYHAGKIAVFC